MADVSAWIVGAQIVVPTLGALAGVGASHYLTNKRRGDSMVLQLRQRQMDVCQEILVAASEAHFGCLPLLTKDDGRPIGQALDKLFDARNRALATAPGRVLNAVDAYRGTCLHAATKITMKELTGQVSWAQKNRFRVEISAHFDVLLTEVRKALHVEEGGKIASKLLAPSLEIPENPFPALTGPDAKKASGS